MNGLFYLDEIFYSENSPYLYDIDTFSELQPSRVPFMANGRGSGKRANRYDFWADPAVIAQSTGFSLEEVNDLENLIRKEEIKN